RQRKRGAARDPGGRGAGARPPAVAQPTMTEQDRNEALVPPSWSAPGTYKLPLSGSTLALPQGYAVTFGADAQRAYKLLGNPTELNGLEAMVIGGKDADQIITFESFQIGYVTLDDWWQVDPTALLAQIHRNTERKNQERRQQGVPELRVKHWLKPPDSIATQRQSIGRSQPIRPREHRSAPLLCVSVAMDLKNSLGSLSKTSI